MMDLFLVFYHQDGYDVKPHFIIDMVPQNIAVGSPYQHLLFITCDRSFRFTRKL